MKEDLRKLLKFTTLFRSCLPSYAISSLMVSFRNLIITWLTAFISSRIVETITSGESTDLIRELLIVLILVLAFSAFDSFGLYFQSISLHRIGNMLRARLYESILRTSIPDADQFGQRSELIMRINQDVNTATGFLMYGILVPCMYIISGIGATIVIAKENLLICAGLYVVGFAGLFFQNRIAKRMRRVSAQMQKETSRSLAVFMQTVSRSSEIKMSGMADNCFSVFLRYIHNYKIFRKMYSLDSGLSGGLGETIRFLSFGGVIGVSLYFYYLGKLTLSGVVMISQMSTLITTMVLSLSSSLANIHASLVGVERIFDVVDLPAEHTGGKEFSIHADKKEELIQAKAVSCQFSDGSFAFQNLDLEIPQNRIVALRGESGCGKTTLLRLFLKLYPYTSGSLKSIGEEISSLSAASIREKAAYVPQENILFTGTVRENLMFGNTRDDISDAKLTQLLSDIGALSWIMSMENGLDTDLSEGGANLSGGQKQMIAIARAILYRRPILLLDEAFAGVDTEHIAQIIECIRKTTSIQSVLIVTHDERVTEKCDYTIVM